MISILFINVVVLTIYQTLGQKTIQPYGPKMCEELYQKESSYAAHVFDGVQLVCKLVSYRPRLDRSGSPSSQLDFKVTTHSVMCEEEVISQSGKTNVKKKTPICLPDVMTAFFEDIRNGRLDKVKRFLSRRKVDVNCHGGVGQTAVMIAAAFRQKGIFDFLVKQKCDLLAVDESHYTVLHCACEVGSEYIVQKLLDDHAIDIESRGQYGGTPIMSAVVNGYIDVLKFLLSRGADTKGIDNNNDTILHAACESGIRNMLIFVLSFNTTDIECRGWSGRTPLLHAVYNGHILIVKMLRDRGADVYTNDDNNNNILHVACRGRHVKMVKYVLTLIIFDMECRGHYGRTPLMIAVETGKRQIVKLLRDRGADVHTVDDRNNNILHAACLGCNADMVKYVLALNISKLESRGYLGRTPVMQAVENGHMEVVRLLRRRGADVKTVDDVNDTIIHLACVSGYEDIAKYVLSLKIHGIKYRGKLGRTPLMVAVEHGHIKVVRLLLHRNKARLTTTDRDGLTVLHIACVAGQLDMVKYLVTLKELRGFEKRKNMVGETPIHIAMKKCHFDIVSFLKSRE